MICASHDPMRVQVLENATTCKGPVASHRVPTRNPAMASRMLVQNAGLVSLRSLGQDAPVC